MVNSLLLIITAITTVIAIRAVGILLVTGLIVIPSLIAGILLAFYFDLPPSGILKQSLNEIATAMNLNFWTVHCL